MEGGIAATPDFRIFYFRVRDYKIFYFTKNKKISRENKKKFVSRTRE